MDEQQLVLTVLNLVYHEYVLAENCCSHFQMIRDIKILPYFVHLLENEGARQLHSLVLELIFTTLKIKAIILWSNPRSTRRWWRRTIR